MPVGAGFIPARIGENKKMTEHKKLQPEIRFAGFTDDWEQCKLGEFSKTTIGEFVIKTKQNPNSKYPVYNGGVSYTGFYDDFNNNGHKIIVSARGANAGFINIINGKYWAGNSCYSIDIQSDNYCIEYVYHFMKHKQHLFTDFQQAANIPSVSKKNVEEFLISYPRSKEEQTQIGNFFKQLDDTIALHQRELEKFKILKTSYLENIFLGKVSLFTAKNTITWEQRKLGEVVNVLDNLRIPIAASQRLEGVTPYYGANGIQGYIDGFTHDGEFVLVAEDGANDLINYPVQYVLGKVWINNHAHVLQGIKNVANNLFLVYRIKSMDMTKYLVGGGRTKLNASVMKDIELHLPNYAEQTQIGNFFKQLDDTITLHQKELAKYQQIKAACLEKMFVE